MKIYAADDEKYMLEALTDAIRDAAPQAEITSFENSTDLLSTAKDSPCDVAFLDVQMPELNGVELANKLLALNSHTNIVFVTAFDEYKADAMDLLASDYVTKPVTVEKINKALSNLRHPVCLHRPECRAVTFGNFALYVDGSPVSFHRRKSAELLAYLIDKRGTVVPRAELSYALFADETHSRTAQKQLSNAVTTLQNDLKSVAVGDLLVKTSEGLAVNWEMLKSDLQEYLSGNTALYHGAYMEQYSWAENFKAFAWSHES